MTPQADAAGLTAEEKKTVQTVNASVLRAGKSYAAEDFDASAEYIRTAVKQIEEAAKSGSPRLYDELLPAMKRIEKARTLLDLRESRFPPSRDLSDLRMPPRSPSQERVPPQGNPNRRPRTDSVLRKRLLRFCRHVADDVTHLTAKVGFNLATYAALMKGPPEGVVIFAGDTVGSRLIETIETGICREGLAK